MRGMSAMEAAVLVASLNPTQVRGMLLRHGVPGVDDMTDMECREAAVASLVRRGRV